MSFDLELTGRRALVTAGTKGVGAAVANERALIDRGDEGFMRLCCNRFIIDGEDGTIRR